MNKSFLMATLTMSVLGASPLANADNGDYVEGIAAQATERIREDENYPKVDEDEAKEYFTCVVSSIIDELPKPPKGHRVEAEKIVTLAENPHKPLRDLGVKEMDNMRNFGFRPCRSERPENLPELVK